MAQKNPFPTSYQRTLFHMHKPIVEIVADIYTSQQREMKILNPLHQSLKLVIVVYETAQSYLWNVAFLVVEQDSKTPRATSPFELWSFPINDCFRNAGGS
ncbi:hypothetical protein AVEN_25311-1 [Araneus ventricosus]|uniref:Uncharacterized protein n=1 Tax=Araneus ventricosus TaxID=182803 RepID=A0A4Y2IQV0_ARAVE|nr:hypothetical protein AVEN_25311-1 [Araneus ventricosus]